jgi:hypothetical protein
MLIDPRVEFVISENTPAVCFSTLTPHVYSECRGTHVFDTFMPDSDTRFAPGTQVHVVHELTTNERMFITDGTTREIWWRR